MSENQTPNFQIRKATKEEALIASDIHNSAFEENWGIAEYIETSECYLCDDKGIIIFQIVLDEAEIKTVAVRKEFWGQNLGTKLCEKAIEICKERGVKKLFLEVSEQNPRAVNLYKKVGFVEFNRRPNYYPKNATAILMHLQF